METSVTMDIISIARSVIKSSRKVVTCVNCQEQFEFWTLVCHTQEKHPDLDLHSQCLFCFHYFKDNRYKKHFKSCFRKQVIVPKMLRRQKTSCIKTVAAKRISNIEFPSQETLTRIETRGKLPNRVEWQQSTSLKDTMRRPFIVHSTTCKHILINQMEKSKTLRLATNILLSFQPFKWHHLIICKKHIDLFQRLVRERNDIFIPDFGCWCKSQTLLTQENIRPDKVLHYHLLLYAEEPDWKRDVWKMLVSTDHNRYKMSRVIQSPKHLCQVLLYISQPCVKGGMKHFDIRRPIIGVMELFVKLINPTIFLEEINKFMLIDVAYFDLYKSRDQYDNLIYTTPLKMIMEQIEHFNIPFIEGRTIELSDVATRDDFTLTYAPDYRFVNLVMAERNSTVTVSDVFNLIYPDTDILWANKNRTIVRNIFNTARDRCPRCYPSACGLKPLVFRPSNMTIFSIKRLKVACQVAAYKGKEMLLNNFVTPTGEHVRIRGEVFPTMSEIQLKDYLLFYFKNNVKLVTKDEKTLNYLKNLLIIPENVTTIIAEPLLKKKFNNLKDLEKCAQLVKYDYYDEPLSDIGNEAKLLYELLAVQM